MLECDDDADSPLQPRKPHKCNEMTELEVLRLCLEI
jgi:hypothetical protein